MAGVNATWGSRVTLGLLEACRERDMSFGYIEFLGLSLRIPGGLLVISWIFLDFMVVLWDCHGFHGPYPLVNELTAFTNWKMAQSKFRGFSHFSGDLGGSFHRSVATFTMSASGPSMVWSLGASPMGLSETQGY